MKEAFISVTTVFSSEEEKSETAYTVRGKYGAGKDGVDFFYPEPREMGMGKTRTLVRLSPEGAVIRRSGDVRCNMELVPGEARVFFYETPYGAMELEAIGQGQEWEISDTGCSLEIRYILRQNGVTVGENRLTISIREA